MPRNLSGTYSQPGGTTAAAGNVISSTAYNTLIADIGNEITLSLPRNGSAPMTADLDLGGNDIVNAGALSIASITTTGNFTVTDGVLNVTVNDAASNTVTTMLDLTHTTSGTPQNSIGIGINFNVETAAGNNELGARILVQAVDTTPGSEDFDISFRTMGSGATATEVVRFTSDNYVGIGVTNPSARLQTGGNLTHAAWGTTGIALRVMGATYTDNTTGNNANLGDTVINSIGTPVIAATGTGITIADAYNLVVNTPTAGTNVTLTNRWSTWFNGPVKLTSDLAQDAFRIEQTGTDAAANSFVVYDVASDTTPFVIDNNGRTIVGHSAAVTPATSSAGSAESVAAQVLGAGQATSALAALYYGTNASVSGSLILGRSNNASIGSNSLVSDGDTLGSILFEGSDNTAFRRGARIRAIVEGTPGASDLPTSLLFEVSPDGAVAPAEALRIKPDKNAIFATNIGIAARTPVYNLDIPASLRVSQHLWSEPLASDTEKYGLTVWSSNSADIGTIRIGQQVSSTVGPAIDMYKCNGGATNSARLKVQTSGDGDALGVMSFYGLDRDQASGGAWVKGAQFSVHASGTISAGVVPSQFRWYTINEAGAALDEKMRLSADGKLSIGYAANPANALHVRDVPSSTNTLVAVQRLDRGSTGTPANNIGLVTSYVIMNASSTYKTCAYVGVELVDATNASEDADFIIRLMDGGSAVSANTTEVLRVTSTGTIVLSGNGSKTAPGIKFPATDVASSDANTLDDYQEFDFTPDMQGSGTAGTWTYNSRAGRAVKIGRTVFWMVHLDWSNVTGSPTGNLECKLTGLPNANTVITPAAISFSSLVMNNYQIHAYLATGGNVVGLYNGGNDIAETAISVTGDTAGKLRMSGMYVV